MTVQFKRNVKLMCELSVGEEVNVIGFGPQLDGNHVIEEIKYIGPFQGNNWAGSCESGFMVRIDGYDSWLDSGWFHKIEQ